MAATIDGNVYVIKSNQKFNYMSIGIRTAYKTSADQTRNSNALSTTGLTSPIAAGQTQAFRAWLPISVGASGGVRVQVVVPAGGADFKASIRLNNTQAPSQTIAIQTASAAFTNALANAGNHWLEIEGTVTNGATAGDLDIQIGQNTTDANLLTLLRGAKLEIVKL